MSAVIEILGMICLTVFEYELELYVLACWSVYTKKANLSQNSKYWSETLYLLAMQPLYQGMQRVC